MTTLEILIHKLQAIAHKNEDAFEYKILIVPYKDSMHYRFVCSEIEDYHVFVEGVGVTLEEAISDTSNGIKWACESWEYES